MLLLFVFEPSINHPTLGEKSVYDRISQYIHRWVYVGRIVCLQGSSWNLECVRREIRASDESW